MNYNAAKTMQIPSSLNAKMPFSNLLGLLGQHPQNLTSDILSSFLTRNSQAPNLPPNENFIHIPNFSQKVPEDLQGTTPTTGSPNTESIKLSCFRQMAHTDRMFEAHNLLKNQIASDAMGQRGFEFLSLLKNIPPGAQELGVLPLSQNSKRISKNFDVFPSDRNSQQLPSKENDPFKRRLPKKLRTKRNPWKPSEDSKLMELVEVYGESWAMISSKMKDRTGKQIRDRYLNILRPNLKRGEWGPTDDDRLISLYGQFGHKWSLIAKHMPGRSEAQVKNRFYSSVRKKIAEEKFDEVIGPDVDSLQLASKLEGLEEEASEGSIEEDDQDEQALRTLKSEDSSNRHIKLEDWELKQELKKEVLEEMSPVPVRKAFTKVCDPFRPQPNQGIESISQSVNSNALLANCKPGNETLNIPTFMKDSRLGKIQRIPHFENQLIKEQKKVENLKGTSIKEKEVDIVLEILARYYEHNKNSDQPQSDHESEELDNGFESFEDGAEKRAKRKKQLGSRIMNLEFLLLHTMQEMEKLNKNERSR